MREIVTRRGFLKAAAGGAALAGVPAAASGSLSRSESVLAAGSVLWVSHSSYR